MPNFSNFMTGDKKCKGYQKVIEVLDNSAQEIMEKIIKPYQKNKEGDSGDNRLGKMGYIEDQIRIYLPSAMQEAKKIKGCFDTDTDSIKIAMLEARLKKIKDDWKIIKSFFADLDNIKLDYDLGKRMSEFQNKITNKKLFRNLQHNKTNYPILFAVTDFADYKKKYENIKKLYEKLGSVQSKDEFQKIKNEYEKIK